MIFLDMLLILTVIALLFFIYIFFRNEWVFRMVMETIDRDMGEYAELLPYHDMVWKKFWVYDIEKLKKDK